MSVRCIHNRKNIKFLRNAQQRGKISGKERKISKLMGLQEEQRAGDLNMKCGWGREITTAASYLF